MNETYFNVSHHGSHLFRTDVYTTAADIYRIEQHLAQRFTKRGGYEINRSERPASWTSQQVTN
jgi:hypothetical protein